jgi:SAM-dependent methyltransferase
VTPEHLFRALKSICGKDALFLDKTHYQPSRALLTVKSWHADQRSKRPSGYMNNMAFLKAYCAYYLPRFLPEVFWIFETHKSLRQKEASPTQRLLDIGCGPGTATLSYLLWCQHRKRPLPQEIILIDQSKQALSIAKELIKAIAPEVAVYTQRVDIRNKVTFGKLLRQMERSFDLVLASHLLNEMGSGPRQREQKLDFIEKLLLACCKAEGDLLIVEPALKSPTLDLMQMRNDLFDAGAEIVAPCPQGTAFCPMLRSHAGWCYAQPLRENMKEWGITAWDKALMRYLFVDLSNPGFSYLWIKPGSQTTEPEEKNLHLVAISDTEAKPGLSCDGKKLRHGRVPFRGAIHGLATPTSSKPPKNPSVK